MLDVLADNRDLNLDIYEEMSMLSVNVERLATYRMGMEKGMEKGAHEQAMATAERMLTAGLDMASVASFTGLPLAEVEALAAPKPTRQP